MVCYITHTWAEKEKKVEELQHFDYLEMANAAADFIGSQPDDVVFTEHVEKCFDVLKSEIYSEEPAEWTQEFFAKYY